MKTRAILIIPQLQEIEEIEKIRALYDPLFGKVAPHITIIFPFTSDLSTKKITTHVAEITNSFSRFPIQIQGISGTDYKYLLLNVIKGKEKIIELHDKLYTGILEQHLQPQFPYYPHLTVGRLPDKNSFTKAIETLQSFNLVFKIEVTSLVIERIDSEQHSIIESIVKL